MEDTTQNQDRSALDLAAIREKLGGTKGQEYWRSLEEVADHPEFQEWLEDEFPNRSSLLDIDRRSLLKFMGASMMLAGLTGCRSVFMEQEKIVPYVTMPEDLVPGKALQFATAMPHRGSAIGLLVTSNEGRPTKIEGNPQHPMSMGSSDSFAQAAVLGLYDPDRASTVMLRDQGVSTWDLFFKQIRPKLAEIKKSGGGIRILTETVTSPTLYAQLKKFTNSHPSIGWTQYEPVIPDNEIRGSQIAFGRTVQPLYHLDQADVVVSLDGDFVHSMADSVKMAKDFMSRRHFEGTDVSGMNRLYVLESSPTLTGAVADHRVTLPPSALDAAARALASLVGVGVSASADPATSKTLATIAKDLMAAKGRAVVVVGPSCSAEIHALGHAMNEILGASGRAVTYHARLDGETPAYLPAIQKLADEMNSGQVEALIILGGNPGFDAPSDIKFAEAVAKVPLVIRHGLYVDETSKLAHWHTPDTHFLESWGDVRATDGTVSIVQPLIAPLFNGKSATEFLYALMDEPKPGLDIVREYYKEQSGEVGFDKIWRNWLAAGLVEGTARTETVTVNTAGLGAKVGGNKPPEGGIEAIFRPDPTIWDGRYANLGWLQELPKPLLTTTWDNALVVSPKTADELGVVSEDKVKVDLNGVSVEMAALIQVGHPDGSATLHFGYGRTDAGNVGNGTGVNVYPLRTSRTMWSASQITVTKLAGVAPLALTQTHHSMEHRDIVRMAPVAEFVKNPEFREPGHEEEELTSMYPENDQEFPWDGARWGMTIDLNVCTGCHACVTACQAENNIPVVGKAMVKRGREMHWLRIDRYYRVRQGDKSEDVHDTESKPHEDNLDSQRIETVFMPVACMHCEKAPCEPVCPVAATVHSHEGLNQMVYNRCVGTRYCSNNCPYKVRRFNFLNYTDNQAQFDSDNKRPLLKMLNNPQVTVRGRGVMEKCTYCVQRINAARIEAKKAGTAIPEGAVITACQQACPTGAITFGNLADPKSAVNKSKAQPRNYSLLRELNTRNRTTYLARVRNVNPEMENA